ncbi:hypothetical protein ACFW16_01240 [Inquilinus sp. NPDC058860]|uniref:hypothetical protein n=1 Tax=Inquilinus sp. NPDC058860 TaxID=3346652 RepID=UPI00369E7D34
MKNAIERRVDRLAALWNDAASDPGMRLFCWRCDLDEQRLLGIFTELEHEEVAQTPGSFIRLVSPFSTLQGYASVLATELAAQYEAGREDLRKDGLFAAWQPPDRMEEESPGQHLLRVADSLRAAYADTVQLLVLCLEPGTIADDAAWRRWVESLVQAEIPARLRFMVVDPIDSPRLAGLETERPDRVRLIEPRLDMPAALDELARSEGEEGPAKTFRIHLVTLANAAGKGNTRLVEQAGANGLAVARAEGWADQEVVVLMSLAAARLGAADFDGAAKGYREAVAAARRAGEGGHPAAAKLELSAGMGLGSALLAESRWPEAARIYEACVPLASKADDGMMVLESWRMAAHCHEQARADREAWRCGEHALAAGEALPADQRRSSTLPWVGQTMLRLLARYDGDTPQAVQVRRRLDGLLGPDWERALTPGEAAA